MIADVHEIRTGSKYYVKDDATDTIIKSIVSQTYDALMDSLSEGYRYVRIRNTKEPTHRGIIFDKSVRGDS